MSAVKERCHPVVGWYLDIMLQSEQAQSCSQKSVFFQAVGINCSVQQSTREEPVLVLLNDPRVLGQSPPPERSKRVETAGGRGSGTSATHHTIRSRCKTGLATRGIKSPRQARARDALQRHRPYVSSAAAVTGWRCSELRLHGPPNERRHAGAGRGVPSHAPPQTPPATPTRPKALPLRWTLG